MNKINLYNCYYCNYKTFDKSNINKHYKSKKHQNMIKKYNETNNIDNIDNISNNIDDIKNTKELDTKLNVNYTCVCGKKYKFNYNLNKHHNNCKEYIIFNIKKNTTNNENDKTDIDSNKLIHNLYNETLKLKKKINNVIEKNEIEKNELVSTIIEKNKELISTSNKELIETLPKIISENSNTSITTKNITTKNITNNNITNKNITNKNITNNTMNNMNINIFLNENCKNAINMSHFLSSIRIELKNLIHTEQHGIIEGISNIIMNNINKLSFDERPVHCSDLKREVLYIKNDDIWEKDDENKSKTKDAINHIANLQVKNVKLWKNENPNYLDCDKRKIDL